MIWGYGPVGYGAYRTARILSTPHGEADLFAVAAVVRGSGGVKAFAFVGEERRRRRDFLKFLGPSFGTKFIYFVSKAAGKPTPVMDAVMQRWFGSNAPGVTLSLEWSAADSYAGYVETLNEWGRELGTPADPLPADDVEYLAFSSGAESEGLVWAEPWSASLLSIPGRDLLAMLRSVLVEAGQADAAAAALRTIEELLPGDE